MSQSTPSNSSAPRGPNVERLQAAERRLYPLAMVDTDRYERAVTLVGLLGHYFIEHSVSVDELEDARPGALAVLPTLAGRNAIVHADLDPEMIVDAAIAQRFRALAANASGSAEELAVQRAQDAGEVWATVEEPSASTLGFAVEQRWVDLHLATRIRLVRTIRPDPATGNPIFTVEIFPDGVSTASLLIHAADRLQWLEETGALRDDIERAAQSS